MPSLRVTLTAQNTNYNLYSLIIATAGYTQTKPSVHDLTLTIDPGENAAKVKAGDGNLSDTNFGVELALAGIKQKTWETGNQGNSVSLVDKFLRADTTTTIVDVDFNYA